jgi:hypothetical protein
MTASAQHVDADTIDQDRAVFVAHLDPTIAEWLDLAQRTHDRASDHDAAGDQVEARRLGNLARDFERLAAKKAGLAYDPRLTIAEQRFRFGTVAIEHYETGAR